MKRAKIKRGIRKLPDGRWQIDVRDSKNQRHRRAFATKEEAASEKSRIEAQKSSGEYFASSSNTSFSYALDLLLKRPKKLAMASRLRVESIVGGHIRPALGERKLSEFSAQRMKFVKELLEEKATNYASSSIAHMHSAIKLALDLAIADGVMGAPNPMATFKVGVPEGTEKKVREVLTLDEITAMVRGAMVRDKLERELVFASRFVMMMIGLFTAFRNQECSGLFWDCVDLDGRVIAMRRIWRKGEGIVATSKTGTEGFRDIPMSPVLHAVLCEYADRLRALGRKLEGPVLVTERAGIILPNAIMADHWPTLAEKAGFVQSGALRHTFYALRHTAANLWRTVGLDLLDLKEFMGHTDIATTSKHYVHKTPHFRVLLREVEALGMSSTREGLVDALGIVLAQRWRDESIDIPCSPPAEHSVPARLRPDDRERLALPGNVITLSPDAVSVNGAPALGDAPMSLQALRERQRAFCKEKAALGWKHARIAEAVGIDKTTVSSMVQGADDQMWLRKLGHAERAALRAEARRMRIEDDATNAEIGRALKVQPHRISIWLRGYPMKEWRRVSPKYGQHEALIRQRLAEGKTPIAIARELGVPKSSGIIEFVKRRGIHTPRRRVAKSRDGTA